MAALDLDATMDAIAARIEAGNVTDRTYAWPSDTINVPCAVVGYPEPEIEFDSTFRRGSDHAVFPVWFVVGKASERAARKKLSDIITGATGMVDAFNADPTLGGVVQMASIDGCRIETITSAGVEYIAGRFDVEVYS